MKSYQWVRKQKIRVQKKYIRVFGRYLSPKDFKEWNKRRKITDKYTSHRFVLFDASKIESENKKWVYGLKQQNRCHQ